MADVVSNLIINHPDLSGVWQVASKPISKYDLLNMINKRMDLGIEIEKDEQFTCDRSLNGSKFAERTGFKVPSWEYMIEELSEESI